MSQPWVLIFSDGTGQRGVRDDGGVTDTNVVVKNTNIFQMFSAAEGKPGLETFYDPGLGAPADDEVSWGHKAANLWAKATGWGITANIVDCYEALMLRWRPGMKIGLFGFSRGAYTVRCVGGVLSVCGIATRDGSAPLSPDEKGPGAKRRRAIAEEAVAAYKIKDAGERQAAGNAFAGRYAAEPVVPDVIGVFDTVKSLGLPGVTNMVNPFKHEFHNRELSTRVPVGLHALAIDENRKAFLPELWANSPESSRTSGQIIEQVWFAGVHSDVGGGYDDDWRLADLSLDWMLDRLRNVAQLHIPLTVSVTPANLLGRAHDERTGMGLFWWPAERAVTCKTKTEDPLCANIEDRFQQAMPAYRPKPLRRHPRVSHFY